MRRYALFVVATTLGLLALGLLAYQWMQQPTTLRIAVGPAGAEDAQLVAAMSQYLGREHARVRLRPVLTSGVRENADAVARGRADLAVVRSDVAIPPASQTVAILHRDAAVLMTPAATQIGDVAALRGRRVGIVGPGANAAVLATVLAQSDVPADAVATVPLESGAAAEAALREGGVDALLVVGALTGRTVVETVGAVAQRGPPAFVPVAEAGAIAQRAPTFESVEVLKGAFGGTPPRPAETFTTLGVTHRLVALSTIDDDAIAELTRLIFVMRPAIAAEVALANSKSSSLPVHPGALSYYDGEVETFFERYGDWFYLAVMVLSVAGSALAGLASRAANRSRARDMALLRELLAIVRAARDVPEEAGLDGLERTADEILAAALARAGGGAIDNAGVAAFTLGLDQARRAIAERRRALRDERRGGPHAEDAVAEHRAPFPQAAE